jgi:predicted MFS family arabinose efflux permease
MVTVLFPILNGALGTAGTFFLFFAICIISCVWMLRYVPETRGKSLEGIEAMLREGRVR